MVREPLADLLTRYCRLVEAVAPECGHQLTTRCLLTYAAELYVTLQHAHPAETPTLQRHLHCLVHSGYSADDLRQRLLAVLTAAASAPD